MYLRGNVNLKRPAVHHVMAALVLVCACSNPSAGEAAPPGSAHKAASPPTPRDFLQPPPPSSKSAAASAGQGRALADSASSHDSSAAQRVARWFFSPDAPPAPPQEIQERKPPHGAPPTGFGPPGGKYGPPKAFNQYGPPKGAGGHGHGPPPPPPPPGEYGPPKHSSGHYGPPKPVPLHNGPPSGPRRPSSGRYGPPKPHSPHHLGPPPPAPGRHGPPSGHPSGQFGPPKSPSPGPAYGPPSHQAPAPISSGSRPGPPSHNKGRDCNPCNKVPWIPMSRTPAGVSDQVLALVTPPEAHSGNGGNQYLPPGPSQGKIPPFTPLKTFSGDYGPPVQAGEPEGQYTAPAAHGELPLKGPAGQYGPPAGATAPADDYGPPPPAPAGHFSTTGGAQGSGPAFGPGGPSGHGGHGGLGGHGGHGGHGGPGGHGGHGGNGGHGHGHGGHGGQGPAPSDDYGPPPLPPLLQAPAAPHGNYVPPSQLQPPSAPHPPPHPTAIGGGGGRPQLALAPSFLPAPPVHNARPFHGPAPAVADYLTPPGTGSSVGGAFLGPAPQHPGAAFASGPGPSGPGPALSAPGHGSAPGPGADLDVIKSVTVYTDSQSSAQHSLGADQLGDVYNGDAKQVHLVPDGHGHNTVDQLHLPSGDNDAPGSEDGNHIITHDHSNSQHNTTDDSLEVIKSVRVADFLSSVEYPPEVIQSPYIDLTPPPSGNKDQYSTTFNHAYSSNISPHEEIIVGKPAVNNGDNRNTFQQASASENSPPIKEQLQHHLESNHPPSGGALGPSLNESSAASQTYHSTHSNHHFGTDQKPSSTNKDVVNGPSASSHSSHLHDLNLSGNNLYSSGSLPGSIIRNEEHPSQGLSKNISSSTRSPLEIHSQSQDHVHVITGNEDRQPSQSVLHTGQGIQVPTAPHGLSAPGTQGVLTSPGVQSTSAPQHVAGTQGTQSSVIVDIQPSLQTSAQGASLIYQINGLNTPPSQFQHAYPNTPAQTSVFVSFQHAPQKPFNYPPPSLLNQQLPPPAPFQNTFHQPPPAASAPFAAFQTPPPPPPPAYQPAFPPDAPVSYLNPPAHPFKGFNAATPTPAVAAPPPAPAAESHPRPAWSSASAGGGVGGAALKPPKAESDAAYLAGLLPPPPPRAAQPAAANDGKRTKQIQIIVPYTSSKDLIQFRFPGASPAELDASGWSPIANPEPASNQGRIVPGANNCSDIIADGSIDSPLWQEQAALCRAQVTTVGQSLDAQDDYHLHQESRRVTAKAPLGEKLPPNHKNKPFVAKPGSQTGEIQHIFASNIRDLLRGEEEAKPTADSINLLKLQKNIDEWTAQEFSKHKHLGSNHKTTEHDKGFTASFATGTTLHHLRLPSKQIPEEYLTTTPLSVDDTDPTDLFSPTLPPTYKINDISRTSPSSLFFDHEVSGSHTHSITANVVDKPENKSSGSRNKSSNDATWKFFESNLVLPEAVTVTTTTQIATTTDEFTAETTDTTEPTIQANWDHLEVSISPITKEKVYVVTPLSTWVAPSPSTTPSSPRFTSSGIYQALSRGPTSPRPSPTSINDIIPFRKSVLSPADMLGVTPLPFHSPRFLIRPTPGPSLHRLFTMKASEAGYTPPSPSPPLDAASHAPAHRDDEDADADEDAATAAATALDAATEDNSIHDDLYTLDQDERESSTPAADNSTASRSRGAATLLGLTDLPTYTPPDGARVHTFSGHSKVVTVVTPPTLVTPKKKPAAGFGDKKATTSAASKTASATATATATAITTAGEPLAPTSPAPPAAFDPAAPPAGGDARPSTPRKEPEAYLWHFPELLTDGDELHEDDVAAVREAALDLQKEKRT